jgi:sigma-54 dependent transcriptional regulator, acetoin dehydrogenase operon transcriptional activator AcoR
MNLAAMRDLSSREYARRVARDWERLLGNYSVERPGVRDVVFQSWLRCRSLGVDATQKAAPTGLRTRDHLFAARSGERLAEVIRRSLGTVAPFLAEAGSVVVGGDVSGYLLFVEGDPGLTDDLAANAVVAGANWHENHIGTNAIGTALELGHKVVIHGHEHFCNAGKPWSCAADVIRDPIDRSVLGVVDLTGTANSLALQGGALISALVERIESELARLDLAERVQLTEHYYEQRRDGDSLMVFDRRGRVVRVSRDTSIEGIALTQEVTIPGLNTQTVALWQMDALPEPLRGGYVEPLRDGESIIGGTIRITDRPRARRLAAAPLAPALKTIAMSSPSLEPLLAEAQLLASRMTPILLLGETGTGKDVLAAAIHAASDRAKAPFVAVNCAAIPRELIAGELFGYADGAFTGAKRGGMPGRFEDAHGGTIFLDEIGDMAMEMQPYLLRILEDRAVSRLGESRRRPIDVRIIAATNRSLSQDVATGRFRMDLFYRLDVASLRLPPLRERRSDIPTLASNILKQISAGEPVPQLEPAFLASLQLRDWPGNIRELRNTLERWLSGGDLHDQSTQLSIAAPPKAGTLKAIEQQAILSALAECRGDLTRAARRLGISRATMYRRLEEYRAQPSVR